MCKSKKKRQTNDHGLNLIVATLSNPVNSGVGGGGGGGGVEGVAVVKEEEEEEEEPTPGWDNILTQSDKKCSTR